MGTQKNRDQHILTARELRIYPTPAENTLWQALRGRKLAGLKFHRQKVIGSSIADFYCASARLVVEVDGDTHDYQKDYDCERTRAFEDHAYHVIRFQNEMVVMELDKVLSEIGSLAMQRISDLTPNPSPDTRRGEKDLISPEPGRGELTPLSPGFRRVPRSLQREEGAVG